MLEVDIPGHELISLKYLVLDVNGTLALDGHLLPGVRERLEILTEKLDIWLISADTYGTLAELAPTIKAKVRMMEPGNGAIQKAALVTELGPEQVVAIGNGVNDAAMLQQSALGLAVLGPEGVATVCLNAADIVVPSIEAALDLLINQRRLTATLRA